MKAYYTPAEATEITKASRPSLRQYTQRYARYFSTEATPEQGKARRFTVTDLKLIAFIRDKTLVENLSHEDIMLQLEQGELDQFTWSPPQEASNIGPTREGEEGMNTALVSYAQFQASQALLQETRLREQHLQERLEQREQSLQERINQLERELGEAHGELKAVKARYRRPKWLQWLLGGE